MASGALTSVVRHLRRAVLLHDGDCSLSDAQLLGDFVAKQDATAFETLVRRHGPMVLGVCRRILRSESDAEDAFQATFFVLVRKAESIVPREALSKWLYGVAYRTSLGARRARSRRQAKEKHVEMPHRELESNEIWDDLQPLLDHELNRLPDKYRWPVVLCDLEGRTRKAAARQLNLPEGTLSNRLTAARKMLAKRFTRRGLTLSAGGLSGVLSQNALSAEVSASLVGCTVKAAMLTAAGQAVVGVISAPVAELAEGVLKAMLLTKMKQTAVVLLVWSAVAIGAGGAALTARGAKQVEAEKVDTPQPRPNRVEVPKAAALFTTRSHDFGNVAGERQVAWSAQMVNPTNETYRLSGVRVADPAVIASPRSVELTPNDQGTIAVWIDPTRFKGTKTFVVWVHFSEPREEQVMLELTATNDPIATPRRAPDERLRDMEKQLRQLLQDMEALRRDLRSEPAEKSAPRSRIDSKDTRIASGRADDPDRDGDGLSDFQEIHKYFTDPDKRDSDSDGKPDGDWDERREYAYSIRTIIRVMLPINEREIVNDDYQDAGVLARNDRYAELEVIHYPLNTVHAGIRDNPNWREDVHAVQEYLKPGLTTNWDDEMRGQLLKDLAADGIQVDKLNDREVVQRVSAWLLKSVKSGRYFNLFHVHFPDGKPEPYPGQENSVGDRGDPTWTLQQQWDHELFGRQMYQHRACGTCTSTAILMTTVLKAVGIPTRMILCTPIVDASGGDNVELVRKGLTHHAIRESIVSALKRLKNSNASHTFCEVFVGNRWRRLNFKVLGQNTLDPKLFGLLTHVNTFNDLADANLAATWGARKPDEVFRYANAYTAAGVSDLFGAHSHIPNPPVSPDRPLNNLVVSKAYWLETKDLPSCINRDKFKQDGSGHLFLHAEKPSVGGNPEHYQAFYEEVAKGFVLTAPGNLDVSAAAERGYWLNSDLDYREFYVRVPPEEMKKLKPGVSYLLKAVDQKKAAQWTISPQVTITRP